MRTLLKLILISLLLAPLALAGLLWSALSDQPRVEPGRTLSANDIEQARVFIARNDPRRLPAGASRDLVAQQRDLALAANYILQKFIPGGADVTLRLGTASTDITLELPWLEAPRYLNLTLRLGVENGQPTLQGIALGQHELPPKPIELAVRRLLPLLLPDEMRLAGNVVEDLAIHDGHMQLTFRWHPELLEEIRTRVFTDGDRTAMRAYHRRLVQLSEERSLRGSLMPVLGIMFSLAELRAEDSDPVTENRALLLVLGAWASGRGSGALLPQADGRIAPFRLRLHGRRDFAQHFLSSGALAAGGDSTLSDAVGLFKEIRDAGGGSGFSFTDIAADRAGTRFGQYATRDARTARRVQRLMAGGLDESAVMPDARDLPEHLSEAEFRRRFSSVGSPAYLAVMRDIETRIQHSGIYN